MQKSFHFMLLAPVLLKRRTFLSTLFLLFSIQFAWAQIPRTISYQGFLGDSGGNAVSDGDYTLTFQLYDSATDGNSLWSETQTVTVSDGIFNVILGSEDPLNIPFDKQYWLGITIGDGSELAPRVQLTAAPYSLSSVGGGGGAGDGHSLDAADGNPVDAVFVDNEGRVGIGTTSPGQTLDVRGGIRMEGSNIELQYASFGTTRWRVGLNITGPPTQDYSIGRFGHPEDFYMQQSSGNIGVGTTSPTAKIHIGGTAGVDGIKFPDGTLQTTAAAGSGGSTGGDHNHHSLGAEDGDPIDAVFVDAEGRVGIGTTSPLGTLDVRGRSIRIEGNNVELQYASLGTTRWRLGTNIASGSSDDYSIGRFGHPEDFYMQQSSGNIGIGTTSPTAKLEIGGTAGVDGIKFPDGTLQTTAAAGSGGGTGEDHNHHSLSAEDGDPIDAVFVDNNGRVGIGTTSPSQNVDVRGSIRMEGSQVELQYASFGTTRWRVGTNIAGGSADDYSIGRFAHPEDFYMQRSSGNIGIGTTSPAAKLHIGGTAGVDGIMFPDGTIQTTAAAGPSSRRWKKNINHIVGALDKIEHLRGVSFDWKSNGKHDIGLIAEEVGEVIPEVVSYEENGIDAISVNYAHLVAVLIEAMKEQQNQIGKQNATIEALVERITAIEGKNRLTSK